MHSNVSSRISSCGGWSEMPDSAYDSNRQKILRHPEGYSSGSFHPTSSGRDYQQTFSREGRELAQNSSRPFLLDSTCAGNQRAISSELGYRSSRSFSPDNEQDQRTFSRGQAHHSSRPFLLNSTCAGNQREISSELGYHSSRSFSPDSLAQDHQQTVLREQAHHSSRHLHLDLTGVRKHQANSSTPGYHSSKSFKQTSPEAGQQQAMTKGPAHYSTLLSDVPVKRGVVASAWNMYDNKKIPKSLRKFLRSNKRQEKKQNKLKQLKAAARTGNLTLLGTCHKIVDF